MPAGRRIPARCPGRRSTRRLVGGLVLASAVVTIAAYLLLGPVREARETATACESIQQEVQGLLTSDGQPGNPDELAARFTASAARIREEGARAGGEVEQTAEKLASAVDETAAYYRSLASGDVQIPNYSGMNGTVTEFQDVCKSALPGHG